MLVECLSLPRLSLQGAEADEAIQSSSCLPIDCFAPLAIDDWLCRKIGSSHKRNGRPKPPVPLYRQEPELLDLVDDD
ncbi:MAG: hypothetical protein U9N14_02430, partial [Pseudomonadota bacterium]|nr:hypothetical protein [Pseudomonadota bacterium]